MNNDMAHFVDAFSNVTRKHWFKKL